MRNAHHGLAAVNASQAFLQGCLAFISSPPSPQTEQGAPSAEPPAQCKRVWYCWETRHTCDVLLSLI